MYPPSFRELFGALVLLCAGFCVGTIAFIVALNWIQRTLDPPPPVGEPPQSEIYSLGRVHALRVIYNHEGETYLIDFTWSGMTQLHDNEVYAIVTGVLDQHGVNVNSPALITRALYEANIRWAISDVNVYQVPSEQIEDLK